MSLPKPNKYTPLNYTDEKIWIYFELGSKDCIDTDYMLKKIDFIHKEDLREKEFGFDLLIAYQQIPEVVRILSKENQSI